MHFEVEQKFPVQDASNLERRLKELGAIEVAVIEQIDQYFNHPARDYAVTDEALRLRRVGTANYITYKGPKLDVTTKTRREIELPLPAGPAVAAGFGDLLIAIGFRLVAEVRKTRRQWDINWNGHTIDGALDNVVGVGVYMELEQAVGEEEVESAKMSIASLATALGLAQSERRSYLELMLVKS